MTLPSNSRTVQWRRNHSLVRTKLSNITQSAFQFFSTHLSHYMSKSNLVFAPNCSSDFSPLRAESANLKLFQAQGHWLNFNDSLFVSVNLLRMTVLKTIQLCLPRVPCSLEAVEEQILYPQYIHSIEQTGATVGQMFSMLMGRMCANFTNNSWHSTSPFLLL